MSLPGDFDVQCVEGELGLRFPRKSAWLAAVKRLRTRRFDPETGLWWVPAAHAPELLDAVQGAGAPEKWLALLRPHCREALAAAAQRQARRLQACEEVLPYLAERHPGLMPHQREGVEFLLTPAPTRGLILADEMGLGKTRQAIVAAHEAAAEGRILVVCPAGLKLHWKRELERVLGARAEIAIVEGKDFKKARWTIINYDLVKRHHKALLKEAWAVAILDEAHYVKNRHSQRSRLLLGGEGKRGLPAGRVPGVLRRAERVFLLTGTPITNRPLDLFPLLQAIEHPLGDDLMAYGLRYCAAYSNGFGWDMKGASNLDELHERVDGAMLRRVKEEVLELPPKLRTYLPVEVDLVAYRQVWRDYVEQLRKRKGRRRGGKRALLAEIAKLRHAAALSKIPAAAALVQDMLAQDEKVIVFSGYHAVVDALMERFGAAAVRVTGREDALARHAAVTAFQEDPAVRVFVGNLQAAGVGVTLTAASQVVFVDYSFVPADHLQAEDRPCRIGQRSAVTITYLSAVGTIDEEVEALLALKMDHVAQAIDGAAPSLAGSFLDELLEVVERKSGV